MLRFLQSIFGKVDKGRYPDTLVKEAIERAVDGTDPWLRGVSGYKKKLRPAVIRAIDHVVALVDGLPPPLAAGLACYDDDDPLLKAFFMSTAEMRKVYGSDRNLAEFRRGSGSVPSQVVALLVMEKREGVTLGAELVGEIVMRDVPQATVTFESHRLLDPSGDEKQTRRLLMRRAFDHLLSLALSRIAVVKSERQDLERRRSLHEAKLNLLKRGGYGFDETASGGLTFTALEEGLGQIEAQLLEIGGDDRILETYLDIVIDVLGRPEEQIWGRKETLIVNRLGIRQSQAAFDAPELTLNELWNAEGRSLVMSLIALPGDDLRGLA